MKRLLLALAFVGMCSLGLVACAQCNEECENMCAEADCACESDQDGECKCADCGEELAAVCLETS